MERGNNTIEIVSNPHSDFMTQRTLIKHIIDEKTSPPIGSTVLVKGWVRTLRDQKKFAFIELNDGSSLANLQIIAAEDLPHFQSLLSQVSTGAALSISGELVESPGKGQRVELKAQEIEIVGLCDEDYPLQKKRHSFEFLRSIAHLRTRTNSLGAVARIRSCLSHASHRFFEKEDFIHVHTPIITSSDCEGAGEMFRLTTTEEEKKAKPEEAHFFGRQAYLTVSGQLNAESAALALSNVYTFGPTFRAENSNTSRHLAEFWMLEPEMAFAGLEETCKLAEKYLKFVLKELLEKCPQDLNLFNQFIAKGLIDKLSAVIDQPFEIMTYTEAVKILEASNAPFEFPVHWGVDLQSEHERYLTEKHLMKPLMVINYPKDIKAFYMRNNDDGKTCSAVDVLVPKMGEIIGGAQREDRYDVLKEKMLQSGLDTEAYDWYLDLRRYGGTPHAGFGPRF